MGSLSSNSFLAVISEKQRLKVSDIHKNRGYRFGIWSLLVIGIVSLLLFCPMVSAAAPVAQFTGTPLNGPSPLTVAFTDASQGIPTGWAWFFGDENWTVPAWTQMTANAWWTARWGQGSVAMPDGSIILTGGAAGGCLNDTWRSTDNGATWIQMNASAGWTVRYRHSSVAMPDGSIVLMGGWDSGIPKNDVWRSTDNGATWTQQTASAGWLARWMHSSVAMPDGSIVLTGGFDSGGSRKNDTWRSTDNGTTWTQLTASAGWTARSEHSSVAMPDGSIVLMGGEDNSGSRRNDTWRSTDNGATWTQLTTSAGWSARATHSSVAMPDGSIVLMGGSASGGLKNDVWRLMPAGTSEQNPSHTYTATGIYQVALQAYNTLGYNSTRKTGYITVTEPSAPVANFTATVTSGTAPLAVQFTDISSGTPISWNWSFGDGNFSIIPNPSHTYGNYGMYTVDLTVSNPNGSSTLTRPGYITVFQTHENRNYIFASAWGVNGSADGQFFLPQSVATDHAGNVYVTDYWNCRVQKFSSNGTFITTWGSRGAGDGQFNPGIQGIAADTMGSVYVADAGNQRIQKFSNTGAFLGKWGTYGTNDGEFNGPWGVTVTVNGDVYVADWMNHRVQKFSNTGAFLGKWGTPGSGDGQLSSPTGISSDPAGNIYVMEYSNQRVQKFSSTGAFLGKWGIPGSGDGQFSWPYGIANDAAGNVYVADTNNNRIQKFNASEAFLKTWGSAGAGNGQFDRPQSVAADAEGNIYVVDPYNSRIQKFTPVFVPPVDPPVANFTANITSGKAPLPVSFIDLSVNTPNGWAWYFGDETFTESWTQMNASAGWAIRAFHSSVVLPDGSIVLMGGCNNIRLNDVWRSTDNGATWTQVNASPGWSARYMFSSVAMPDGSIVLMGGSDGSARNDVWQSTDKGTTWTQQTASAGWAERSRHSSVAMPDGSIVLMGGYDGGYFKNDVWRSTDNGATWTEVNASPGWAERWAHSSVVMPDGSIVLMGGQNSGGNKNDVWRSTDNGATWTQLPDAGWSARSSHRSVAMPDGSIVLMGGYDSGATNDVWRSSDNGATWTQVNASAGWSARGEHSSVVMPDGSIVLMGGWIVGGSNDVWRLVPTGSSEQNPSHTYTTMGTYPVALQAYNARGYNRTQKTGYITVTERDPVANFTATVTSGAAPLTVQFNDTSTGSPASWSWSFGDGSGSSEREPVHIYSSVGNYTVNLTAGRSNMTSTLSRPEYIHVTPRRPDTMYLFPGWNFISVPKKLAAGSDTASVVFAGVNTEGRTIWKYNSSAGAWYNMTADDPIKPLYGIWIFSAHATAVPLTFDIPQNPQLPLTRTLYPGWNAIGFTGTVPASARDMLSSADSIWSVLFGFDAYNGPYTVIHGGGPAFADTKELSMGNGFWVFVSSEGTLAAIG